MCDVIINRILMCFNEAHPLFCAFSLDYGGVYEQTCILTGHCKGKDYRSHLYCTRVKDVSEYATLGFILKLFKDDMGELIACVPSA